MPGNRSLLIKLVDMDLFPNHHGGLSRSLGGSFDSAALGFSLQNARNNLIIHDKRYSTEYCILVFPKHNELDQWKFNLPRSENPNARICPLDNSR